MQFDFGWLGRGVVLHHVTPEEPLLQRARFVMYSNLNPIYAKFFMLSEANHVSCETADMCSVRARHLCVG